MKKKKVVKKLNTFQEKNKKENKDKDIVQSIGSFNDFLIMEKKDKIKETTLEFKNIESDNNFLNDFLILQRLPKPEKSRFSDFFKEINELDKKNKIEEPKIEKNEIQEPINNPQSPNQRFGSYDGNLSYFSINQYPNQINENYNFSKKNKLYNNKFNFSNPNSRSTSDSGFTGHGGSFSIKSTNTINSNYSNPFYKTSSSSSIESNIINNNINFNNNNNMNNNIFHIFPNNVGNINMISTNNIYNNNYIEKEFDPVINIKKVLSFEDKRTTIMIKNLPNKFTREKLLDIIDKKFKNTYDIFILPRDSNKNRNFGYAFMNFLSSYYIPHFYYEFNGKSWINTNSIKVCEITYSKFQGLKELVSHYPNKITFLNNEIIVNSGINNIFIPNEYKLLFKQLFPNQQIEENDIGFITKVSF